MKNLYNLGIKTYTLLINLAALASPKAKQWITGRKNWRNRYQAAFQPTTKVLWVHVASLGEFEQGRPVIEAFKQQYPHWQIVLSFFSPSGYEIRKDYPLANFVCYLPADTPQNAKDFLAIIQPDLAIFVKYEFWANYLFELKCRNTPTLLVAALFRPTQAFFQWHGGFWRRVLDCFTHIFVQDPNSQALLQSIGYQKVSIGGDTRIDRVLALAQQAPPVAALENIKKPILVAGSTWPADEAILLDFISQHQGEQPFCYIVAAHEPSTAHSEQLIQKIAISAERWTDLEGRPFTKDLLIIDTIGLLNRLYRHGTVAYIGGGFGKGIHNTLEPAAFGLPIIFGPRYEKFEEARQFVARGAAFCVHDAASLAKVLDLLNDDAQYALARDAALAYLHENAGGTQKVMDYLERSPYFFPEIR